MDILYILVRLIGITGGCALLGFSLYQIIKNLVKLWNDDKEHM